jgi:hypothetical protein
MRSLYVLALLLVSCSRHDSGATSLDLTQAQAERDQLCATFDPASVPRCDRATFHVLMSAMCGEALPTEYESPSGKWNRDLEPCYPTDSSSETSADTYLGVIMSHDKAAIDRFVKLAEPQGWNTGLPAGGVGNIQYLTPLLPKLELNPIISTAIDATISAYAKVTTGVRAHLIAFYIWESARQNGGVTALEASTLATLSDATPADPLLACLKHRFGDGDQSNTLALLQVLPQELNDFGWGSAPWQIFYTSTVACLEGK